MLGIKKKKTPEDDSLENKSMSVIVTLPPYASYLEEVVKSHVVSGMRINTVMPEKGSLEELLTSLKNKLGEKKLWIDLKARQLRITNSVYVPYSYIKISHKIKVDTPADAWFKIDDETYVGTIVEIEDGNKLVIENLPPKPLGEGMAVNILDPSLEIDGYLTDKDKRYIEAAKKVGIHTYMLSYVEQESDITDLLKLDPDAEIIAKIESKKGLEFVETIYLKYKDKVRLMLARGDLYLEVDRPHLILNAAQKIIDADKNAVAASRILNSMETVNNSSHPAKINMVNCTDLFDIKSLWDSGYKEFLLGDELCFDKRTLCPALKILEAIKKDYCDIYSKKKEEELE